MTSHRERMDQFADCALYVVITEAFCAGRSALDVLDACLDAGVRLIQVREKDLEALELYRRAQAFRARTRAAGALLIIDDRVDLALAVEADGVHLGRSDLPIDAARRIAPELILGASSHDPGQAAEAQNAGASYVNIGPIYATQTKTHTAAPVGPEMISRVAACLSVPFTCMGGIKAHNVHELVARGARHIAVVTAVTAAPDIAGAVQALHQAIRHA